MKNSTFLYILIALLGLAHAPIAQNINWRSFDIGQKHILNLNAGFDYGITWGVGYGYKLATKIPIVLNMEYSSPAGEHPFDDLKTKFGAQAEVARLGNFSATVRVMGNFRRYENDLVRLASFGSEISGTIGYFKPRWFVAGEFAHDKAIVTHFKHRPLAREDFPYVQDGWYLPTAGNVSFGIQSGFSFRKNDVYLKIGKVVSQDFKATPMVPFYFQMGWNKRI